jgi:hypothetical protein
MSGVSFIGAGSLERAMHAHGDRTQMLGPRPVHRIVASLGADADEVQAAFQALRDLREPTNPGEYAGGLLDGFVVGVRAARAAAGEPS